MIDTTQTLNPMMLMVLLAFLTLLPFVAIMVTSYVKLVVVFSLVRNALGIQAIPPNMVLNGLAVILSLFIMAPVFSNMEEIVKTKKLTDIGNITQFINVVQEIKEPVRVFLKKMADKKVVEVFANTAKEIWPKEKKQEISYDHLMILIPAFTISELTSAFQVGFLLYLPFLAIDLIVSNILLALGMMMVSPMTISLPFKLLLFVSLDGWLKITQGIIMTYR